MTTPCWRAANAVITCSASGRRCEVRPAIAENSSRASRLWSQSRVSRDYRGERDIGRRHDAVRGHLSANSAVNCTCARLDRVRCRVYRRDRARPIPPRDVLREQIGLPRRTPPRRRNRTSYPSPNPAPSSSPNRPPSRARVERARPGGPLGCVSKLLRVRGTAMARSDGILAARTNATVVSSIEPKVRRRSRRW